MKGYVTIYLSLTCHTILSSFDYNRLAQATLLKLLRKYGIAEADYILV